MNYATHFETRIHLTRHLLSWRSTWRPDIVFLLTLALAWLTFALPLEAQTFNTAYGTNALVAITTGDNNSAFGFGALDQDKDGSGNTAVGSAALDGNVSGSSNTAVGHGALNSNRASDNPATGALSLLS